MGKNCVWGENHRGFFFCWTLVERLFERLVSPWRDKHVMGILRVMRQSTKKSSHTHSLNNIPPPLTFARENEHPLKEESRTSIQDWIWTSDSCESKRSESWGEIRPSWRYGCGTTQHQWKRKSQVLCHQTGKEGQVEEEAPRSRLCLFEGQRWVADDLLCFMQDLVRFCFPSLTRISCWGRYLTLIAQVPLYMCRSNWARGWGN